jgi:hypothetical protein
MAKTYRTNPHGEEHPRRSNRTTGKSPATRVNLPARKPAKRNKTTAARKDTASREDTAASEQRKGPPEAIVLAPEAVPLL